MKKKVMLFLYLLFPFLFFLSLMFIQAGSLDFTWWRQLDSLSKTVLILFGIFVSWGLWEMWKINEWLDGRDIL